MKEPGLYALGEPDENSPVIVTANYKLTFDIVRSKLVGFNLYILVLDTKGVNVWCAAGKGTFGTDELITRLKATHLSEVVAHRTLILPQLGAVGVAAHEIKKQTGFKVVFGPVRAEDLSTFLINEMNATPEMRQVRFPLRDRFVLIPVELVGFVLPTLLLALFLTGLSIFHHNGLYFDAHEAKIILRNTVLAYVGGGRYHPDLLTLDSLPKLLGKRGACRDCFGHAHQRYHDALATHYDGYQLFHRDELYRLINIHVFIRGSKRNEARGSLATGCACYGNSLVYGAATHRINYANYLSKKRFNTNPECR